jgi:hypothetical protein
MSLEESAYITSPGIRELSILESKSMIKFAVSQGHLPRTHLKLLELNDPIILRTYTQARSPEQLRALNESMGVDLALGVGQMIPGVKTVAGIAGVAYYAAQAYGSYNEGSILGAAGNLFLTLLSAAAIEPLGATSFLAPVVTLLGPITKLGKALETFMGLIVKGAFGPVGKFIAKNPALKSFIDNIAKRGTGVLEQAVGWLGKNATRLAQWFEKKGVEWAAKPGPAGEVGRLGKFLGPKVASAAQTMSKFVTNLKLFITSGGQAGLTHTMSAQAAKDAVIAADAAALKIAKEAGITKAYKAAGGNVDALLKANPELAKKLGPNLTKLQDLALQKSVAEKSIAAAEAAAGAAGAQAGAAGTQVAAPAAAGTTLATPAAAQNLFSAIRTDLASLSARVDSSIVNRILSPAEALQTKAAMRGMRGRQFTSGGKNYFFNNSGTVSVRQRINGELVTLPGKPMTPQQFQDLLMKSPEIQATLIQNGITSARVPRAIMAMAGTAAGGAGGQPQYDTTDYSAELAALQERFDMIRLRREMMVL